MDAGFRCITKAEFSDLSQGKSKWEQPEGPKEREK